MSDRVRLSLKLTAALIAVAVLAAIPSMNRTVGSLLPGPVNSPGSLQLLSLMLIAAATAVTLDVMFGYTGLLSFGHALYFGIGCYATVMLSNSDALGFTAAVPLALVITFVCALVGNASALNLSGMGFSMTTLALAQVMYIGVERGYLSSGGEFGLTYDPGVLPRTFIGLANTKHAYWLALALLVLVYLLSALAVRTQTGHVWQAIRENPLRAQVLGYNVYRYQLASGVFASTLAGLCGVVYSIVMSGANPSIVLLGYSLSFVLMVVLGGRGVLWGAMLGGLIYTFLNLRLSSLSGSDSVSGLPEVVRVPLSQPNFILGVIFVLVILFAPGGLASVLTRERTRRPTLFGRSRSRPDAGAHEAPATQTADAPAVS